MVGERERDTLALSIRGERAWPDRGSLERFGAEACEVTIAGGVIDEIADRAVDFTYEASESAIREQIPASAGAVRTRRRRRTTA